MNPDTFEVTLSQRPHSPLFARVAAGYLAAGRIDDAKQLLTDGCERYPGYFTARFFLARCYAAENDYAKALEVLNQAEGIAPDQKIIWHDKREWQSHLPDAVTPEVFSLPEIPGSAEEVLDVSVVEEISPDHGPEPADQSLLTTQEIPPLTEEAPPQFTITEPTIQPDAVPAPEAESGPVSPEKDDIPSSLDAKLDYLEMEQGETEPEEMFGDETAPVSVSGQVPDESDEWALPEDVQTTTLPAEGIPVAPSAVIPEAGPSIPEGSGEEIVSAAGFAEPSVTESAEARREPPSPVSDEVARPPEVKIDAPVSHKVIISREEPREDEKVRLSGPEGSTLPAPGEMTGGKESITPPDLSQYQDLPVTTDDENRRIVSRTLAEIYAKQGAYEEAILTYQLLKRARPGERAVIDQRIGELALMLRDKLSHQQETG